MTLPQPTKQQVEQFLCVIDAMEQQLLAASRSLPLKSRQLDAEIVGIYDKTVHSNHWLGNADYVAGCLAEILTLFKGEGTSSQRRIRAYAVMHKLVHSAAGHGTTPLEFAYAVYNGCLRVQIEHPYVVGLPDALPGLESHGDLALWLLCGIGPVGVRKDSGVPVQPRKRTRCSGKDKVLESAVR
jgi:hypothetical protein